MVILTLITTINQSITFILLCIANSTTYISFIFALITLIVAFVFVLKNMTAVLQQGDEILFGHSVQVSHSVPQMKMLKVHIPFSFKVQETSCSKEVHCSVSSEVPFKFLAFWGVAIRELHYFLSGSWESAFEQENLFQVCYQEAGVNLKEESQEERSVILNLPENELNLGLPPRHSYPLVVLLIRNSLEALNPEDTLALINIVHIKDPEFSLPTTLLAQYLKLNNGQVSCLKQLYLASGDALSYDSGTSPVEQLCVICQYYPLSRAFLPCRHTCVCASCFGKLQTCPLCRSPIKSYFCIRSEDYLQEFKPPPSPPTPFFEWIQAKVNSFFGFPP